MLSGWRKLGGAKAQVRLVAVPVKPALQATLHDWPGHVPSIAPSQAPVVRPSQLAVHVVLLGRLFVHGFPVHTSHAARGWRMPRHG